MIAGTGVPVLPATAWTSDPAAVPVNWGAAGWPSASTPTWPGKTIEVGTFRVLCSTTVTVSPAVTHSVGPGSWKAPLAPAKPQL